MIYIAIGPFAWGRGFSPEEALKNCKQNIAWHYVKGPTCKVQIYACPDHYAYVNEMGGVVHHTKDLDGNTLDGPSEHCPARTVRRPK